MKRVLAVSVLICGLVAASLAVQVAATNRPRNTQPAVPSPPPPPTRERPAAVLPPPLGEPPPVPKLKPTPTPTPPEVLDPDSIVRVDRKSTRLNSSHTDISRMPSSA